MIFLVCVYVVTETALELLKSLFWVMRGFLAIGRLHSRCEAIGRISSDLIVKKS